MRLVITVAMGLCGVNPVALNAQELSSLNQKATGVTSKKWSSFQWSGTSTTSEFSEQRFPTPRWGKRSSRLGSKRAGRTFDKRFDRKLLGRKTKSYKKLEREMSRLHQDLSSIFERAGIQTDQRSEEISNQALYSMMLQSTRKYEEIAEKVSLRDINRFQFRRNRSDGAIPVEQLSGDDVN